MFYEGLKHDLSEYHQVLGLSASLQEDNVVVNWEGELGNKLRLVFTVASSGPIVRELAIQVPQDGSWKVLGRDLTPVYTCTTGKRRRLESGWVNTDLFDAPLLYPQEVRHFTASFEPSALKVCTVGNRLEISCSGMRMGIFSGQLCFTVYRGCSLIRLEAILKTDEPDVAYFYNCGLKGFSTKDLERVVWLDLGGNRQCNEFFGSVNQAWVPVKAKHRMILAEGPRGSVAAFPPPHQFFFPREWVPNLGYVWYKKEASEGEMSTFSFGVRQHPTEEPYVGAPMEGRPQVDRPTQPLWPRGNYPLYNAPPGTWQRMGMFFHVNSGTAEQTMEAVLAYTHRDKLKELPGYKTMITHFHWAFTQDLLNNGMDTGATFIPVLKTLGVNITMLSEFHGDMHGFDPGPIRLMELEAIYDACHRYSDRNFLLLPGEEPNIYLCDSSHWDLFFPRQVYWFRTSAQETPFIEIHPKYGRVYHPHNSEEIMEMVKQEKGLVWQAHPRCKSSRGYPDGVKDKDYYQSDLWLGAAFKAMPADLSLYRLGERCFRVLDDMNNWGQHKFLVGEVDTWKMQPYDDYYGHNNVNYVKLDHLPSLEDWSELLHVLRAGDFFVTTGEVLIRSFTVNGKSSGQTVTCSPGSKLDLVMDLEWTFPLECLEVVWGDGQKVECQVIPAADTTAFGEFRSSLSVDSQGKRWIRFAAWDIAGNGAFTQPVYLEH